MRLMGVPPVTRAALFYNTTITRACKRRFHNLILQDEVVRTASSSTDVGVVPSPGPSGSKGVDVAVSPSSDSKGVDVAVSPSPLSDPKEVDEAIGEQSASAMLARTLRRRESDFAPALIATAWTYQGTTKVENPTVAALMALQQSVNDTVEEALRFVDVLEKESIVAGLNRPLSDCHLLSGVQSACQ